MDTRHMTRPQERAIISTPFLTVKPLRRVLYVDKTKQKLIVAVIIGSDNNSIAESFLKLIFPFRWIGVEGLFNFITYYILLL